MANNRKSRKMVDKEDYNILKPIDIFTLGSEDDPCFGKLHDLKAPECMECGDAEFCSIMKAQNLHKERIKVESKQRFKDIEESDFEMGKLKHEAKDLILDYKTRDYPRLKTILIVSRKLNLSKDIVKNLYDND